MTIPASGTIVFCDFDGTITVNETLSTSDFEMAATADMVFARDRLLRELQDTKRPAIPFDDFFDIRRAMKRREEEKC